MAEACACIMEAEQKAGRKLVTVGLTRRLDPSHREMKTIFDTSEDGVVRLNGQELPLRAGFHEWHYYPRIDDTEVAKQSPILPRDWLSQHVSASPLKPAEPARERQRTAESEPPAAETDPIPAPGHGHHGFDIASSGKNKAGLGTQEIIQPARLQVGDSPREIRGGWRTEGLIIMVGVGIAVVAGSVLAPKLRLPTPSMQVLLGFVLALAPGLESLHVPPEAVLLLFLPGLLFWKSLTTSKNAIRRGLRGILITSTVFVVATAFAAAWVASSLGVLWEAALILGAAVAPSDAAAAATLAKGLPRRQFVLLKVESLINDGTALMVYIIATGLVPGGQCILWDITCMAVVSFFDGTLIGIAVAAVAYPALHCLHKPITVNMALLVTPHVAHLTTELVHTSGVLAAVMAGLIISTLSNQLGIPESRIQAEHFWPPVTSLLNGALFPLIGIEMHLLVANFSFSELLTLTGTAIGVAVTLMVSRFVFLQVTVIIIRALDRRSEQRQRRLSYQVRVVSAISTFRGGASLTIALSIPLVMKDGSPFPYRDEVVLVVTLAIVTGMVVQGPLLPKMTAWAVKGGHTGDDEEAELTEEQLTTEGRLAILEAARLELPALAEQARVFPRVAEAMEERPDDIAAHIGAGNEEEDVAEIVAPERLRGAVLQWKRELLGQFVRGWRISDETTWILRAHMDLEGIHRSGYLPYE